MGSPAAQKNYIFDGHKLIYHPDRVSEFIEEGDCYPLYIEISPVGSCNHRCIFCAYDFIGHPDRRLDTARLMDFIDEIADCKIKSILLSGEGEPLLHPDIDKIVSRAKTCGIDVGVYTNGQLLSEQLLDSVLPSLTFIRFSFNGGTRENYAKMHGVKPEVFDRVISNIKKAVAIKRRNGLCADIGAQYVLLPENIGYLIDGISALKNAGIDYLSIKPFVQQSASQTYKIKRQFNLEAIGAILDEAERSSGRNFKVIARRDSFKRYGERMYEHCLGTSFISALNSAGDIAACLPYWDSEEFVFGNIYRKTFKEIWHGEKRRKIKENLEKRLDVKRCPPNCRPHAVNEFLREVSSPSVRHLNFV